MSVARTVSLSFSSSLLLGSSSKRLASTPRSVRQPHSVSRRRLHIVMATPSQPLEVCVKAAVTSPEKLGDCPFSQRVLLTLEEKKLPYDLKLIDLSRKPDWFTEANPEGKVPVIKFDEKWVSDSDVITKMLEERFPERPLATPHDKAAAGSKIFSAFINFLKSKDPSDATAQELINELKSFNDHIKEHCSMTRVSNMMSVHSFVEMEVFSMR
ncbi:Glutathione S-transferase [Nymphaea thermarum]|nr:Glutathione S-transferase [Nymphaea thermarum]